MFVCCCFFFKQKTAYELRISDGSSDVCSSDLLLIETPYGRVFHTGDWKLDEAPVLGAPSTAAALDAIGDKGVLALVCDSTNVFNAEASGSESSLRAGLQIGRASCRERVCPYV